MNLSSLLQILLRIFRHLFHLLAIHFSHTLSRSLILISFSFHILSPCFILCTHFFVYSLHRANTVSFFLLRVLFPYMFFYYFSYTISSIFRLLLSIPGMFYFSFLVHVCILLLLHTITFPSAFPFLPFTGCTSNLIVSVFSILGYKLF